MIEPKLFYRRMEQLLERVSTRRGGRHFGDRLMAALVEEMGQELGLVGADLYRRRSGTLARATTFGAEGPDLSGELEARLDAAVRDPIAELPWSGVTAAGQTGLFSLPGDPDTIAVLRFAEDEALSPVARASQMLAVVSSLHFALPQHTRRRELEDLLEQARAIQTSLLPATPPRFGDFDVSAVSLPASTVGGDFFDLLPLDDDTLVLAVADASGHGLPAALQARDVATGLRMGVERDLKITRTVEKLNRVIHRSGLSSRFVSLVFGELETNGNFSYINAGHPPPLLLDDRGLHELAVGGMILGPNPEARYKLGFAHLDRGAALVLYTDGVIERGTERGDPFQMEHLVAWLREWRHGPASDAVEDLLRRLRSADSGAPFSDDVTVLLVRRPS